MNFCSSCGARVALRIPDGDHLQRQVCTACGTIHYENPKLVAGCVPEHDRRILLCRRAIEPRRGYWTIPAGFMENEETLQQAAARECWEEALAPFMPQLAPGGFRASASAGRGACGRSTSASRSW